MTLLWCRFMLWAIEFEIAITPRDAGHYGSLKQDRTYWQGEVQKLELNKRSIST